MKQILACLLLAAAVPTYPTYAAEPTVSFDIPEGDTAQALNLFAQQANIQLMFPYAIAARFHTAGLKGNYSKEEAIRKLIEGTGFEVASATADTITLRERAAKPVDPPKVDAGGVDTLDQVIVTGRAGTEEQKQIDASYAITAISEEKMRLAAPVSVADALKSVPGVWVEASGGEAANNIRIRGIPSDGFSAIGLYEDGLPIQHDGGLDWFNTDESFRLDETIQRMEAVRGGPASIFASYAPGGLINFITRKGTDKFETLVKVQAGDYGYGRADAWVGGPVGGFRVGLGGFYRKDHGVRDPGFDADADRGGQVRLSIGKDFDNGSIDFNVKHLDDRVIFYLGVPFTQDTKGNIRAIPGFDPLYDTFDGPDTSHLTFRTNEGPYNFNLTNGVHTQLTQWTTTFKFEVGEGWQINDGIRYRDSTMHRTGLFPNTPFTNGTDGINDFLTSLPASLGAVAAHYVYVDHPDQTFDPVNQNGNGLVMPASAREQDATLKELINDARLQRKFQVGDQSHDVALGIYFARNEEQFLQRGAQLLVDVRPRAQVLDLVATNAAGQPVAHMTDNGFVRYGSQFEFGFGSSNSEAAYLSDAWQVTDKLRFDIGGRVEHVSMHGQAEEDAEIDLMQSPTPADDNADMGTGVFDRWHKSYTGWSATLAANYQFVPNLGAFARITKGVRLPSLGSFLTDPTNDEPRTAGIKMAELGLKAQGEHYDFYGTAFYTGFDSLAFGETVFDPKTNGFVDRTSFTDTEAYGVELEGTWRPVRFFDLGLNSSLQKPLYGKFAFTDEDGFHDFSHRIQTRTPEVSFRAIPGLNLFDGKVRAQLTVDYYGRRYADAANTQVLPAYYMMHAELRYMLNDDVTFYLYANNLTNQIALDEGNPRSGQFISQDPGQAYFIARPEFGRTFRVAAMYKF